MFRWTFDEDGDITLSIARCLHFTFYKRAEEPMVRWGRLKTSPGTREDWFRVHRNNG